MLGVPLAKAAAAAPSPSPAKDLGLRIFRSGIRPHWDFRNRRVTTKQVALVAQPYICHPHAIQELRRGWRL